MTELFDRMLRCRDCLSEFRWTVRAQLHFANEGWPPPKRCQPCRRKYQLGISAAAETSIGAFDAIDNARKHRPRRRQ